MSKKKKRTTDPLKEKETILMIIVDSFLDRELKTFLKQNNISISELRKRKDEEAIALKNTRDIINGIGFKLNIYFKQEYFNKANKIISELNKKYNNELVFIDIVVGIGLLMKYIEDSKMKYYRNIDFNAVEDTFNYIEGKNFHLHMDDENFRGSFQDLVNRCFDIADEIFGMIFPDK